MRKYLLLFLIIPFFFGCTTNSVNNKNPYIQNYSFSVDLNMNLPAYSSLQFVGNPVYYRGAGSSKGIYVFCTGVGSYNAFDAACPNQDINSCAAMTIKGGYAVCTCDHAEYSFFTGQSSGKQYPMKQYRVEVNGNMLRVYN